MANPKKSGLGRGLNSLLGGSFDEGSPMKEPPRTQQRTIINEEDAAAALVVERAAKLNSHRPQVVETKQVTKSNHRVTVDSEDELSKDASSINPSTTPTDLSKEIQQQPVEAEVLTDEAVVIKEVIARGNDEVPIDQVVPNPDQPRTMFKKEELEELARSIEQDGLLQPILVRPVDGLYQIIAGERRWQACKLLGLKLVPIRIKEATDTKALELALVENIQRSDLNPIEEAYGYKRLMDRNNLTQSEVAQVVSKGRSTIANSLRLLDLPEDAQQLLFEEKITAGHARAILSITSTEGRQKLTERLVTTKISVREAEAFARLLEGRQKSQDSGAVRVSSPVYFKKAAKGLREALGTNVRLKTVKGKNKIEIEFKDETELNRLLEQMTTYHKQALEQAQEMDH